MKNLKKAQLKRKKGIQIGNFMAYDVNSNYPSITIGVPCLTGQINVQTSTSLIKILTSMSFPRHLSVVRNTYLHIARRQNVLDARKFKTSHLFFLDGDMKVDGDIILKLLAHDKDVVGVNYNQRGLPLLSTVRFKEMVETEKKPKGDIGTDITVAQKYTGRYRAATQIPESLFECDAVGAGCMLINMKVFDAIEKPWFFYEYDEQYPVGEDVWFCRQVQKAGLRIWCDPTINVKHIGEYEY